MRRVIMMAEITGIAIKTECKGQVSKCITEFFKFRSGLF